jgi:hypothetical protein
VNTAATSFSLPLYPLNFIRLGKAGVGLVGVLCASILFGMLVIRKPQSTALLDGMVLLACIVQLLAVALQGQALGRGVSVLLAQRAPAALWQAWLRQWLLSVTRYWALLSIAIASLMLAPGSPQHWPTAPALLSLLLCFCTSAVLARAGLLPRRLGAALEVLLLALVLWLAATGQMMHGLHRFAAMPAWLLAACAMAWPVKACWIMHSQADALRSVRGPQSDVLRRMRDAIARWAGRFQPLRPNAYDASAQAPNRRWLLVLAIMQNFIFFSQLVPVEWGEQVTSQRLSRLSMICIICCNNALLVRDLHWRTLLLPGGTQLRHLGTRIVLSTMLFQAPLMLAFTAGSVLLSPQTWGLNTLASKAVPLMELACCTVLMTLVRAFPRRVQVGAYMALGIPMLYFTLWSIFKQDLPQLTWQIGPAYALLLIAVTSTALVIANRRWTPARLLNALSTGLAK